MKKTIVIAHNYTKNSFAYMSYSLAHFLANDGHKVIFMSHKPFFEKPIYEKVNNGELIVYSWSNENKRPTGYIDFLLFARIFLKHKPDICIGHFVGENITSIVSKIFSLGKTKVYNYYHTLSSQLNIDSTLSTPKRKILKFRKKIYSKLFVDCFICPSNLSKEDLFQVFGIKKSCVILNPLEDRFISDQNNINNNEIMLSFLGRIDFSKGIFELVEAFIKYIENNKNTKIKLQIAGNGSKVELLKNKIAGIEKIKFYGGLEYNAVDAYIKSGHYLVIPSLFDNLPTTGLEALMNEKPVLISNNTGLTNYLNDNYDCYKFDVNNEEIVNVLERVENNFGDYYKMTENARKTYLELFTIEKYNNKIKTLLFDIK